MKNRLIAAALLAGAGLLHFNLTAVALPVATTLAATSISTNGATLHGTVNPGGAIAVAYFQYGLTTNYGSIGGFMALPATNTAQTLPGLVVNALPGPAGANWTNTGLPSTNWQSIASSADGRRLAALVGGSAAGETGGIYTSTNSGVTWTQTSAPSEPWKGIASSADGMRLAAAVYFGGIYISTNGGSTWTLTSAPSSFWYSIASSADGTRLAAACYQGTFGIATSTNSGVTWTVTSAPDVYWESIASSADGMRLAAVADGSGIYTSTNGGGTWTPSYALGLYWNSIASSADGMTLVASSGEFYLYTSTDGGVTWTDSDPNGNGAFYSVTSSADGSLLAAGGGGGIFTSADGGLAWTPTSEPGVQWSSIATSADGSQLAAVDDGGGIVTSTGTASPLTLGTTYHYRVVGLNSAGTSKGSDLTFTTPAGAPTATTLTATSITSSNASLNGTVNPVGAVTSAYFQYGLTTSYGSYSATNTLGATNVALPVTNLISSLTPGTTYHFELVAGNSVGTNAGADQTFTTGPAAPIVSISTPSPITSTQATLHGSVNPNGAATSAYYQYGLTTNYGSYSTTNTSAATNASFNKTYIISNLAPGTLYHVQLVAGNSVGTTASADRGFTTSAGTPMATTLPAGGITATSATLNGSLFTGGLNASAYFQYGLTTNYGSYGATNTLAATNVTLYVSDLISNLAPGTTYHFQLVSSNSAGASLGNDLTLTTSPGAPTVTTLAASGVTSTSAILNGSVNPNGDTTWAYFEYGLTTNYDNLGAVTALPATNTAQTLPGLVVNALLGPAGATWTLTSAPTTNWLSIASSADGTKLAAVANGEYGSAIYLSANSGNSWTHAGVSDFSWVGIASSADGTQLAAAGSSGHIFTSVNSGASWTYSDAPYARWVGIASSADGTRLAAAASQYIYTSVNSGSSWALSGAPNASWHSIASSADGTRLAAVVNGGGIYTSTNSGATWTLTSAPATSWQAIASSADGLRLAAMANYGGIYTSADGGATWTLTSAPNNYWGAITSSADGTRLAAAADYVYTSTNSGATWTQTSAPNDYWGAIASSADGTRLAVGSAYGGIYTSTGPTNNLTPATTYHYRAVGYNLAGTVYGNDLTFTTAPAAPTVTTLAATGISTTNATVNGTVNPNGAATKAYFRYGLTANYGSYSATNTLAATNVALSVTNLISSLTPGTTYHFELVASNIDGATAGADMLFTTSSQVQATNFSLHGPVISPGGAFQFSFTNLSGLSFTVLGTTNLALPLTNWIVLGAPVEAPPGHYQFTDPQATNSPSRYYCVRSP